MLRLVLLLAGLAGLSPANPPGTAELESTRLSNGAAVAVHRQPGVPVVSLRMSILAPDPAGYSGAGHMIQHVLFPSLRDRAARVGGVVQIQRTSDAIVYTASGPAAELDFLAQLLVSALSPPAAPIDVILRAERELREERLAEWETAPAHTRALLRAQVFPADLSAAGTDRAATRFTGSSLPTIWGQMYQPERVSVVAVGDVYLADVEEAFAAIPGPSEVRRLGIERDSVVLMSLAPPQATRAWFGYAYLTTDLPAAAVTTTARLLGELLRDRVPTAQVDAEHWWTHHGQSIVLVIAAPEAAVPLARRSLGTAVGTLLEEVEARDVTQAAATIRREMLFYSRTPDRMAEVIGQFIDRDGDPNGTEQFYADLDRMRAADVREVLETILERTPARVEIPPQLLRPRR
jgi:predicted Zn-dependent peptidase